MTNKDKELLLKDLCSRLPYGVILKCADLVGEELRSITKEGLINNDYDINEVKPCLFPLSSMTEEQKRELIALAKYEDKCEESCGFDSSGHYIDVVGEYEYKDNQECIILFPNCIGIDFCNKHHLDYRGLIEKGIAIDATNLNIY